MATIATLYFHTPEMCQEIQLLSWARPTPLGQYRTSLTISLANSLGQDVTLPQAELSMLLVPDSLVIILFARLMLLTDRQTWFHIWVGCNACYDGSMQLLARMLPKKTAL